MLINGGFGFDTDTILDAISHFFDIAFKTEHYEETGQHGHRKPRSSRKRQFEKLNLLRSAHSPKDRLTIIINGAERFFDIGGRPLSAELDQFLHSVADIEKARRKAHRKQRDFHPKVNVILFGTERIRDYVGKLKLEDCNFSDLGVRRARGEPAPAPENDHVIPNRYLDEVWSVAMEKGLTPKPSLQREIERYEAQSTGRISGDSIELRKAFFGSIFDDENLARLLGCGSGNDVERRRDMVVMARRILQKLAYVGLPVNYPVLLRVVYGNDTISFGDLRLFHAAVAALHQARLVIFLALYLPCESPSAQRQREKPDARHCRLALHRSLLTELRFRYGIPLSEAKLSTAFNMSLYIAQPIDGDIPDTDIHEDLGQAIDGLIGSYRCPRGLHDASTSLERFAAEFGFSSEEYRDVLHQVGKACGASDYGKEKPDDVAAMALHELCSNDYAEALRSVLALVRSYYSTTGLLTLDAGDRILKEGHDGILLEHAERLDDLIDAYAKSSLARAALVSAITVRKPQFSGVLPTVEPFYAEDLIWLHNERGVVRLAMGDLYEARRSFVQAHQINRKHVERDDRAHNWRRITLNEIVVDIERGRLVRAERKCDQIRSILPRRRLREDRLAEAVVQGLEGWCAQMRGQTMKALSHFEIADRALQALGEVRAQAFFGRSRADALSAAREQAESRHEALERTLDLAQSARQMDIVHRLQLSRADSIIFGAIPPTNQQRAEAIRHIEDALSYALHTNVHRVRCEASMLTARTRLAMTDFEGALRFASDAMMVASRYGMELRKISLRALIAEIMAARGHPVTAETLARTCIKMATRRHFQTAIDKASRVISRLPRLSAAIVQSDESGRRQF